MFFAKPQRVQRKKINPEYPGCVICGFARINLIKNYREHVTNNALLTT